MESLIISLSAMKTISAIYIPFEPLCVICIRVRTLGSFYPSMKEVAMERDILKAKLPSENY